jgi:lysophospholipase L1-like esterase
VEPATTRPVRFDGETGKDVVAGERFWSDPVDLEIPEGHLLAFTWSISTFGVASPVPYAHVPIASSFTARGASPAGQESAAGFVSSGERLVAPQAFATEVPATSRRLCFLGDSITQGIGSSKDTYRFWAARIASGLGPEVAVWNLGSGWARAADAASDGYWLYKAKQCAEVVVALGVNDLNTVANLTAPTLLGDLGTIIAALRAHTSDVKIILFSVPPFNYSGAKYAVWKQTNDAILGGQVPGADRTFDVGAVLSQPAPNDGLPRSEYVNGGDAHPNDAGSAAIADAFLAWYSR